MKEKFQNKYRISSARLQNWDYGWNASYFVTICTDDHDCFFGEIVDRKMQLSEIGCLAKQFWLEIPNHFPYVQLNAFVVMPNHIHGIVVIDNYNARIRQCQLETKKELTEETRQCLVSTVDKKEMEKKTIGQKRFQNQGKNTLSSIIGSYKSVVTKNARIIHADFSWQSRFYDHIIRNDKSFIRIEEYINNNVSNWKDDKFFDKS
jgi:REP element-mobilizing transposase RayT